MNLIIININFNVVKLNTYVGWSNPTKKKKNRLLCQKFNQKKYTVKTICNDF